MNSPSNNIVTDSFGEGIRKVTYEVGELVTKYHPPTNSYVHAIIIDTKERDWTTGKEFKNVYTVAIQNNNGATATHIVKNVLSIDLYLPHLKDSLNQQHAAIAKRLQTFP